MMESINLGLLAVGLATLCGIMGYMITGLARGVQIQADILATLHEMAKLLAQLQLKEVQTTQEIMRATHWRDLPPDAQLMMRQQLVRVLAEMEQELPKRH